MFRNISFGLPLFKKEMSRYSNCIMDDATLLAQENAKLKQELSKRESDHEALLKATQTLIADRDQLANRVQELEAITKRLTDMLWGRRSEQRGFDPNQLELFANQPAEEVEEPTPEEEAEAIVD
jgi:phosphoenolpyruvate-protein kinase (PTS system EI component)